jgi:hypothetical protein
MPQGLRAADDRRPRRPAIRVTKTGARFDPLLPFERWRTLGARVGTCASASGWWLGDWLAFGHAKYGRRYKEAIAVTGLDYQTLRNYAVVSRRFEHHRRRDDVTFQHHAEVCALPDDEQDRWLDRAAADGWSRNELRQRMRAARPSDRRAACVLRLRVESARVEAWRDAATRAECDYETWIVRVLDSAAGAP